MLLVFARSSATNVNGTQDATPCPKFPTSGLTCFVEHTGCKDPPSCSQLCTKYETRPSQTSMALWRRVSHPPLLLWAPRAKHVLGEQEGWPVLDFGWVTCWKIGYCEIRLMMENDLHVHISQNIPIQTEKQNIFEGSLEVKLPTICTDEKQSRAEAERRERLEERRVEEKESEKRRYRCAKR